MSIFTPTKLNDSTVFNEILLWYMYHTNILLVCCKQKPARVLQDTLHKLFDELSTRHGLGHNIDEINLEMGSFDTDFKKKRNEVMDGVRIRFLFICIISFAVVTNSIYSPKSTLKLYVVKASFLL